MAEVDNILKELGWFAEDTLNCVPMLQWELRVRCRAHDVRRRPKFSRIDYVNGIGK